MARSTDGCPLIAAALVLPRLWNALPGMTALLPGPLPLLTHSIHPLLLIPDDSQIKLIIILKTLKMRMIKDCLSMVEEQVAMSLLSILRCLPLVRANENGTKRPSPMPLRGKPVPHSTTAGSETNRRAIGHVGINTETDTVIAAVSIIGYLTVTKAGYQTGKVDYPIVKVDTPTVRADYQIGTVAAVYSQIGTVA